VAEPAGAQSLIGAVLGELEQSAIDGLPEGVADLLRCHPLAEEEQYDWTSLAIDRRLAYPSTTQSTTVKHLPSAKFH